MYNPTGVLLLFVAVLFGDAGWQGSHISVHGQAIEQGGYPKNIWAFFEYGKDQVFQGAKLKELDPFVDLVLQTWHRHNPEFTVGCMFPFVVVIDHAVVAVLLVPKQAVCGRRCSPRSAGAARSSGATREVSSRTTKTRAWAATSGKGTREPQVGRERRTGGASHGRPRPLRRRLSHVRTRGAASSARARHQAEPAPVPGRAPPHALAAAVRRRPAAAKGAVPRRSWHCAASVPGRPRCLN